MRTSSVVPERVDSRRQRGRRLAMQAAGTLGAIVIIAACSAGGGGTDKTFPGSGGSAGSGGAGAAGGGQGGSFGGFGGGGNAGSGGLIGGDAGPVTPIGPAFEYDDPGATGAYKDPELADGVEDSFGGSETSAGQPVLVYPLGGSMHAQNLANITLQWTQGSASNTLFRIEVTLGAENYRFYVPCDAAQCTYEMPDNEWLTLGRDHAGESASITVAGTDGNGGDVALSAAVEITYSPEPVVGALYYWAAAQNSIKRATFGSDKAVDFIAPNSATNDFECAACHSVSRNGEVIAFAVAPEGGEDVAGIQTAPTDDPASPYLAPAKGTSPYPSATANAPTEYFGHNVALSPTGELMAVNGVPNTTDTWPPYLEIRNTQSGDVLAHYDLGDALFGTNRIGILPEWSPDGTELVVTLADATGDDANFGCVWTSETCRSGIAVLRWTGSELTSLRVLVEPDSASDKREVHFYPSWSPDGEWVAFVSAEWSSANQNQKSISNPGGILRLIRATGGPHTCPGSDCVDLVNGTQYSFADGKAGNGKYSSWPKFAPFAQGENDSIMFIAFNTRIDYGFLSSGETQLWMFGLDVSKVGSGDPSFTPFWLPYQDFSDGSLTPYWTTALPCNLDPGGGCAGCVGEEECVVDESNGCFCFTRPK